MAQTYDHEYDIVVVGSGNGAMTAAICAAKTGARTLVIEKSDQYGGTSATSGGGVWIPNNRYAKAAGADDSPEEATTYIRHVARPEVREELIDVYVREGPRMIDYLHENTDWVRYVNLQHYPDYFPADPGGRSGNRSMEPEILDGLLLGKELWQLRKQHPQTHLPGGITFTQVEGQVLLGGLPGWKSMMARRVWEYMSDIRMRWRSTRDRRLTMGNAGIARLRLAMRDLNVPLWLNCALSELIVDDSGRVSGVVAEKPGQGTVRIGATKGVILAAGGFERNAELREKYLPHPTNTEWSAANMHNTGDAIVAAQQLGAATSQMDWGWWTTTCVIPGREKAHLMMVEKSMPGNYTVNQKGERFSNESQNYVGFVEDLFREYKNGNPCVPCYMIFDSDFRRERPCGPLPQAKLFPDWMVPRSWWTQSFLTKAKTLEGLAQKISVDKIGLLETSAKVNSYAEEGKDLDFQRGDNDYDRYYGDPRFKNPCLGPLRQPPFYAMAMYPGEMGTAGGLVIDAHGRVLRDDSDETPIAGLYATGNCTAALLPSYPGPGSTLGPAMVFGYLAARHATGLSEEAPA